MHRRALWFNVRIGKQSVPHYHCPVCKLDQTDIDEGTYVQIGATAHAIVCAACVPLVRKMIDQLLPGALVEVDDRDFRIAEKKPPTIPPPRPGV